MSPGRRYDPSFCCLKALTSTTAELLHVETLPGAACFHVFRLGSLWEESAGFLPDAPKRLPSSHTRRLPCGAPKSWIGPRGTIRVGLMSSWV